MIIAVTGTPGTGKDTVSKTIAKKLGWKLIDLNQVAKENSFISGYDKKRKCCIVDIKKLSSEIRKLRQNLIIQSHYSYELSNDLIIVLRTEIKELKKRLEKRRWSKEKIDENIEAEIFDVCGEEAKERNKKVFEINTSTKSPEQCAEEAINIIFREMVEVKNDIKLPEKLLTYFKKPYGKVFESADDFLKSMIKTTGNGLLICVGDQASYSVTESWMEPDIIVFDNKVRRQPFKKKIIFSGKEFKVINRPSVISKSLWNTIKKAINSKQKIRIFVVGEEDLAVLPFVIMAPLGSVIIYGQPETMFESERVKSSLVAVYVDIVKKKNALELLQQMMKMQIYKHRSIYT